MLKDVRNATALAAEHFPDASLLPAVERVLAKAVADGEPTEDYTRGVAYLERLAKRDLRCPPPPPPPPSLHKGT